MLAVGKIVVPMAGTDCVADTDLQTSFPVETSRVGLHRERQGMTPQPGQAEAGTPALTLPAVSLLAQVTGNLKGIPGARKGRRERDAFCG